MLNNINLLVILFAGLCLWLILLFVETLTRMKWLSGEFARKSIHVYSGFFLALLPLFANRAEIILINILFFIAVVLLSGITHYFKADAQIDRWSWGQFLYPLGVLLVAVFFQDPVIYSFSVLILALADGFAAIFGKKYGHFHYHIMGANKTLLGSVVFFLITLTIMLTYISSYGIGDNVSYVFVILGALSLTLIEGSIAAGFDNLVIPLGAAVILAVL